jgi:hypothetical protein
MYAKIIHPIWSPWPLYEVRNRVARFFLVHDTKTGKMYQMNTKCTKWSKKFPSPQNISAFFNLRPSKIYPNWGFWFEKKPSGNPGAQHVSNGCQWGIMRKRTMAKLRRRPIGFFSPKRNLTHFPTFFWVVLHQTVFWSVADVKHWRSVQWRFV